MLIKKKRFESEKHKSYIDGFYKGYKAGYENGYSAGRIENITPNELRTMLGLKRIKEGDK